MRTRQIIASCLLILGFLIHTVGGELTDIKYLIATDIADNIKIELRGVWYLVSIDFLVSGIFMIFILLKKITGQNSLLVNFIGIRMLLYGCMFFLLIIFYDSKLLLQVPQWILLICIGVLFCWGKMKNIRRYA